MLSSSIRWQFSSSPLSQQFGAKSHFFSIGIHVPSEQLNSNCLQLLNISFNLWSPGCSRQIFFDSRIQMPSPTGNSFFLIEAIVLLFPVSIISHHVFLSFHWIVLAKKPSHTGLVFTLSFSLNTYFVSMHFPFSSHIPFN